MSPVTASTSSRFELGGLQRCGPPGATDHHLSRRPHAPATSERRSAARSGLPFPDGEAATGGGSPPNRSGTARSLTRRLGGRTPWNSQPARPYPNSRRTRPGPGAAHTLTSNARGAPAPAPNVITMTFCFPCPLVPETMTAVSRQRSIGQQPDDGELRRALRRLFDRDAKEKPIDPLNHRRCPDSAPRLIVPRGAPMRPTALQPPEPPVPMPADRIDRPMAIIPGTELPEALKGMYYCG